MSQVLTAPGGRVYVRFADPWRTSIATPSGTIWCSLAQIDQTTGAPTCIEEQATVYLDGIRSVMGPLNAAGGVLQAAPDGAIVYSGIRTTPGVNGGTNILNRYLDGTTTALIAPAAMRVWDFAALPTGDVLYVGNTGDIFTNMGVEMWTRVYFGGVTRKLASTGAHWLRVAPDGRTYLAIANNVYRLNAVTRALEPLVVDCSVFPPGSQRDGGGQPWACTDFSSHRSIAFADSGIAYLAGVDESTNGWPSREGRASLYRFDIAGGLPVVRVPSALDDVRSVSNAGRNVLVRGSVAGRSALAIVDPTGPNGGLERLLVTSGYTIGETRYQRSADVVWFEGTRESDGASGIGRVDVATGAVSFTVSVALADLQLMP